MQDKIVHTDNNVVLNVIHFLVHIYRVELIPGNRVTSNEPLPSWEPVAPEVTAQGWGGADTPW